MNVFSDIAVGLDDDSLLMSPAQAVADRTLALPEPRSLCEIQPDENDYLWLCGWAGRLTPWHMQRWLSGFRSRAIALQSGAVVLSHSDAAGCLLLLLAAESARREASEGNIWPTVRRRFTESARRVLFDAQGQPRRDFKDAIEGAARKLGLRHIFGVEGAHNYYISVYLQFGFTRKGIERLPHWLAGSPASEPVSCLLGDTDGKRARLSSDSFVSLWNVLRNYRWNNVTEANARRALIRSPWALPEWSDALIEQAVKSREIPEREPDAGFLDPPPPNFLAEAKLHWDLSAEPVFTTAVVNLADFDLTSDRYRAVIGSNRLTTLLRTDDGQYTTMPEQVALPSETADFTIALADDNGTVVASQLVQLWNPDEDVELFDLATGDRLDAFSTQRAPSKDYGLLVSPDLMVKPSGLRFHSVGSGVHGKRLYFLPAGGDQTVRITLSEAKGGASEVWNSASGGGIRAKLPEPSWASRVYTSIVPPGPEWLGRYRSIRIVVPIDDIAVQDVRVGGMPLNFAPDGDRDYQTEEFDISTSISAARPHQIRVKLVLRRGSERTTVERDCLANSYGVMRATGDGWEVVDPAERLFANDALRSTYRLVMSETGVQVSDLALMEGSVFLDRAWSRPRGLRKLGGYGAPLEVRAPYNPTDDGSSLVIASEVCDTGVLTGVLRSVGGELCLRFRDILEPGSGHEIILWSIGALPRTFRAADVVIQQGDDWRLRGVDYPARHFCVAVSYDGDLIGAWWPDRAARISVEDAESALTIAAMLRWIHAPIMSSGWLNEVQAFAQQYPAQVLSAWFREEGLPNGLVNRVASSELWGAVVREVFVGWAPDQATAQAVIHALGEGDSDEDRVSDSLYLLLREAPLLMGRVARAWLEPAGGADQRQTARDGLRLVERLRLLVADVPEESVSPFEVELWQNGELDEEPQSKPLTRSEKQQAEQDKGRELLDNAASAMGVDSGYLDNGVIGKVLGPLDYAQLDNMNRNNAETALNIQPFRELLGLRILASLTNGA